LMHKRGRTRMLLVLLLGGKRLENTRTRCIGPLVSVIRTIRTEGSAGSQRKQTVRRRSRSLNSSNQRLFTSVFANGGGRGCYESRRRPGGHRAQRGKRARRNFFARARLRVLKTVGNCRGLSAMRRTTLSISARKRPPKPGASASYQSCASMSSARAASVKRTGHTTGNAVRVLP
jgi:hypothetical protein